eukprot:GABW01003584.1.p1 GENE.GABW01003584.1~~GABW01003584.1.p1  ORF type:complete len:126 (-),score=21.96 GABW01003584.1:24-401(-)
MAGRRWCDGLCLTHVVSGLAFDQVESQFFGGGSEFINAVQQNYVIFSVDLVENTANHTFEYEYDDDFLAALEYLPEDINEAGGAELYDTLLSYWGNTVIVSSAPRWCLADAQHNEGKSAEHWLQS